MNNSQLLQAFKGNNRRVPVWLMRQAGRFLPEYQTIKKILTLKEMFRTPEIAARITLLPVEILKVDAAILFADILTLPSAMGFKIDFVDGKGPVVGNPIESAKDIKRVGDFGDLAYIGKTIQIINRELPGDIPLIGFAGAPFTVASYLIKGRGALGFSSAVRFAIENPQAFHTLMKVITRNTITYLNLQKDAGIKVFQLFDSWGGVWREKDYEQFVLPYVQEIFRKVDLPSIFYLKNCSHLLKCMERSGAQVLSVCETVTIGNNTILNKTKKGVQGNLYNGLLYGDDTTLRQEVRKLLTAARKHHKKYIFNLNHGILPDIEVEKVRLVVEEVRKFKWT